MRSSLLVFASFVLWMVFTYNLAKRSDLMAVLSLLGCGVCFNLYMKGEE